MVEKFSKHTPDQIVHRLKKTRQKLQADRLTERIEVLLHCLSPGVVGSSPHGSHPGTGVRELRATRHGSPQRHGQA